MCIRRRRVGPDATRATRREPRSLSGACRNQLPRHQTQKSTMSNVVQVKCTRAPHICRGYGSLFFFCRLSVQWTVVHEIYRRIQVNGAKRKSVKICVRPPIYRQSPFFDAASGCLNV